MADEQEEKTDLEKEEEAAEQEVAQLEDDPPKNLEDWPDGDAKYKTLRWRRGRQRLRRRPHGEPRRRPTCATTRTAP